MVASLQLARGVARGALFTTLCFSVALIVGLAPGGPRPLYLVAALVATSIPFIRAPRSVGMELAGALLVGLAAAVSGLSSGFGWLELSGVAGSLIGGVMILGQPWPVPALNPWVIGIGGLTVIVLALIPLVAEGGALGHDEAAYALKARTWLAGTPDTGWGVHRAPAISMYAYAVLGAGLGEAGLRFLGILSVVALAAATWLLGSSIGTRWVGPLSAAAIVASPELLRRGTEFLSDIPSAAVLVLVMVVIWREFSGEEGPTFGLLWALPLAWLAFYVRYQSLLSLALVGVTVLVLWWDRVRAKPLPLVATVVVGVAGLVPHFVFSRAETGTALGILTTTTEGVIPNSFGAALVDYAALFAWPLAGFTGLVAAGALFWSLFSFRRDRRIRTSILFLLIPAAGQVILVGLVRAGEARFVFFPLALVIVGGIFGIFELSSSWSASFRRAATLGLAVLLVGSLALSIAATRRSVENRAMTFEPVELAARHVEAVSQGRSCSVLTSYTPQITYYSGCFTSSFRTHLEPVDEVGAMPGEVRFMILLEDGKRQPVGMHLAGLVALTTGAPERLNGQRDSAIVYRFR